jgi:hypothetical protein
MKDCPILHLDTNNSKGTALLLRFSSSLRYINVMLLAKFRLLIDTTLSIYLKVKLNSLASSVILLSLISFCITLPHRKRLARGGGTFHSHGNANI